MEALAPTLLGALFVSAQALAVAVLAALQYAGLRHCRAMRYLFAGLTAALARPDSVPDRATTGRPD